MPLKNNSVDYILSLAVLHHIASENLAPYLSEFQRILKPYGKVVVLEPCLLNKSFLSNSVMKLCDNGSFIRDYDSYIKLFEVEDFQTEFKKGQASRYSEISEKLSKREYKEALAFAQRLGLKLVR